LKPTHYLDRLSIRSIARALVKKCRSVCHVKLQFSLESATNVASPLGNVRESQPPDSLAASTGPRIHLCGRRNLLWRGSTDRFPIRNVNGKYGRPPTPGLRQEGTVEAANSVLAPPAPVDSEKRRGRNRIKIAPALGHHLPGGRDRVVQKRKQSRNPRRRQSACRRLGNRITI
jgi:hypothetical protein